MKVSRVLHAGYIFEYSGRSILFDPIFESPFSSNCESFPSIVFDTAQIRNLKFDAVFISHYHDDHCSFESLALINRLTPIYMFCIHDEMIELIRELGFRDVYSIRLGTSIDVGEFKVSIYRALDVAVDSIFKIEAGDIRVLNVVDSWIEPEVVKELAHQGPWDLVLWPFQTMREIEVLCPGQSQLDSRQSNQSEIPDEWGEQLQALQPRFVVPSSCQFRFEEWSWYNEVFFPISYEMFERYINLVLPSSQMVRLDPGDSIMLDNLGIRPGAALQWIKRLDAKTNDYNFTPERMIPTTAWVAQNFPPLSELQHQTLKRFCENEILERFSKIEIDESSYFFAQGDVPAIWRLLLFDSCGRGQQLFYTIQRRTMRRLEDGALDRDEHSGWSTELAAYKLWSALEEGEQLTSLYLRIKPVEGVDVNPMDDPLLQCLYTNKFAEYQKAQLRRIKRREQSEQ